MGGTFWGRLHSVDWKPNRLRKPALMGRSLRPVLWPVFAYGCLGWMAGDVLLGDVFNF